MPTIKVMSAGAVQSMVTALGAEFERDTGNKLNLNFNTVGSLRERLQAGETADLVILSASAIEALEKTRTIRARQPHRSRPHRHRRGGEGGRCRCRTFPRRRHSSRRCSRRTAVAYTDPKAGGSSGTYFAGLLDKLGIADAVNKKAVLGKRGYEVAQAVADGRAEIGTTFISEALDREGRQGGRPAAGRTAQRQYLYRGDSRRQPPRPRRMRLAARADQSRHPRALDRGRPGAGVLTTLRDRRLLPSYAWTGSETSMDQLKFVVLDEEDLEVVSTHLQDAVVKVSDVLWRPQEKRLVVALNRFDWESAQSAKPEYRRRRTALRFERVLSCKCRDVNPAGKDAVLNLLAVEFSETDAPSGVVTISFSGGADPAARGRVPGSRIGRSRTVLDNDCLPGPCGRRGSRRRQPGRR